MEHWYKCPACNQDLMYGTNPCPHCKCYLAWSQQGPVLYRPPIGESQQQTGQPPVEAEPVTIKLEKAIEPEKKKASGFVIAITIAVGILLVLYGISQLIQSSSPKNTDLITPASPELQQKRLSLINDLINEGIIDKVEKPGTYAQVWVTPLFNALKFDQKQSFINVIYAYYISENPESDAVLLYDSQSGKEVGTYSAVYGGLKMK